MGSLRDLGYELPQAIAELVDNSIDAQATKVDIGVHFDGAESWIRVVDNGNGMTGRSLTEAMRYGSDGIYRPGALGGFGLGLKTASFSQCRTLTVASRRTPTSRPEVRRWDLDDVAANDDWYLERLLPSEAPRALIDPLRESRGTVVLWERLDRVLMYRDPSGVHAEKTLRALTNELSEHLAMVFHRFLSGEARRDLPFSLTINDRPIEPWDPFARNESATKEHPEQRLSLTHNRTDFDVIVRPYVLPSQQRFSSPDAHQAAGGPRKWNGQQGFYVYREDRLIQSGGWNRLRTQDEHTKLARIAVDVPRELDDLLAVNVSKMRVSIPEQIRPGLRALVAGIVSDAQRRYRDHAAPSRITVSDHQEADQTESAGEHGEALQVALQDEVVAELIPRALVVEALRSALGDSAADLRLAVNAILAVDWDPNQVRRWHQEMPDPDR